MPAFLYTGQYLRVTILVEDALGHNLLPGTLPLEIMQLSQFSMCGGQRFTLGSIKVLVCKRLFVDIFLRDAGQGMIHEPYKAPCTQGIKVASLLLFVMLQRLA